MGLSPNNVTSARKGRTADLEHLYRVITAAVAPHGTRSSWPLIWTGESAAPPTR